MVSKAVNVDSLKSRVDCLDDKSHRKQSQTVFTLTENVEVEKIHQVDCLDIQTIKIVQVYNLDIQIIKIYNLDILAGGTAKNFLARHPRTSVPR